MRSRLGEGILAVPMIESESVWPWWLWMLSALWIGTSLLWRPATTATRERWMWVAIAVVYAGLIVFVARITPEPDESAATGSLPLWLGLVAFLASAVIAMGMPTQTWQPWAWGLTGLTAGMLLVLLHAPEAAAAAIVVGGLLARTARETASDSSGIVPPQNQWLVGITAVALLVLTIGVQRHALLAESLRFSASRSQTVFPTREQIARRQVEPASVGMAIPWEKWCLAAVTLLAMATASTSLGRQFALREGTRE